MTHHHRFRDDSLFLEEQLDVLDEFEQKLQERQRVPDRRKLPHRALAPAFRVLGALVLAFNVAALVMLGNFVLFNMLIHATFGGAP